MIKESRMLSYSKHIVMMALYDLLERENGEYERTRDGALTASVMVYDNCSGFSFFVKEHPFQTEISIEIVLPAAGLSEQGERRAISYLLDRLSQNLENTFVLGADVPQG